MKFVHTADTHLGFEIIKVAQSDPEGRRKRAHSILENFRTIVQHALEIEADLFIHSGDLFNKYYISRDVLDTLIQPFMKLTRTGVRVLIIPGNHERSQFPFDLFHGQRGLYVFDRPRSLCFTINGYAVGIAGFPFIREDSRRTFFGALEETEYHELKADLNVLVTQR